MNEPVSGRRLATLAGGAFLVLTAIWLRVFVSTLGANFDFGSYLYIADCVLRGGNPYVLSDRYNYAPGWFLILASLRKIQLVLAPDNRALFHALIAGFLSLADLALAATAAALFGGGWLVAGLILLSPVSILISGYHTQFDVLAIVPALLAAATLRKPGRRNLLVASLLFGLSLVLKHVALLFPIFVLLDGRFGRLRRRVAFAAAGAAIFLGSFLPFAGDGGARWIVRRVFGYSPVHAGGLFPGLLGAVLPAGILPVAAKLVMFGGIAAVAFASRRAPAERSMLRYLPSLVVFSPAIADQYLAIPVVVCAVERRRIAAVSVTAMSTLLLLTSPNDVGALPEMAGVVRALPKIPYAAIQVALLVLVTTVLTRPEAGEPAASGA